MDAPYGRFKISSSRINGPLNLRETVLSAQTSEPEWVKEAGGLFTDIQELNDVPVKYSLSQEGTVDDFSIIVRYLSSESGDRSRQVLTSHLRRVLGLNDDVCSFYKTHSAKDEPLSSTFAVLRGLRLMRGINLYESLICSILSQNNSAKRWNQIARLLMKYYGKRVCLPDGTSYYLFPRPEEVARSTVRELQSRTAMGYRAKSVLHVSKMVSNDELNLETLRRCDYEESMEMLLQLHGVGPKVADCFLLYGAGKLCAAPVDVWIHRIVTKLYFRGRKVTRPEAARFLRERFGVWAGYAQLYLFDYARRIQKEGSAE
jgi:N-glycosylase/DNA lyase